MLLPEFYGSWKLVKTENFAEYLKAIGVGDEQISVAQVLKPTVTFYQDGNCIVLKKETGIHTGEIWFKLGEEFFEKTEDYRHCKNVFTLEGSKLVQLQTWDGNETSIVHEVKNNNMVMTLIFGDTVATITYGKV